jgi:uncharacterized protein YigE (DUF2233 family)
MQSAQTYIRVALFILTATVGAAAAFVLAPSAEADDEVQVLVEEGPYREVLHGGVRYRVFVAEPGAISLHWKDEGGSQYQTLGKLHMALTAKGTQPAMLLNAGIYEPGYVPTGLHVQGGKEATPLNASDGVGNFFLKPNGVFWIGKAGAGVAETGEYAKMKKRPRLATQSGPLLLRNGKVHPKVTPRGLSRKLRHGVGVLPDGKVLFLISVAGERAVQPNLHGFASAFAALGCKDALYLDGSISKMWVKGRDGLKHERLFAGMLAVH